MESKLDIILLGATGFTGSKIAKYLAVFCQTSEYDSIKFGIAGRSKEKMLDLINELQNLGVESSKIRTFICDVSDMDSLLQVTKQSRLLMNATGANTLLSAAIVKACIQTCTDYVDISAELFHMINIYRDFNKAAEAAEVLIVPACGFATIPVVAGLMCLEKNFKGTLQTVDCYTSFKIPFRAHFPWHNNSLIHYGTWASLVHELKNFKQYTQLKKETFPGIGEEENKKPFFHHHEGRIWYPYPGPEHDLIEQTQHYQSKKGNTPYKFNIYTTMPNFIHFLILVPVFFFYYWMCSFACFRKLLWTYPRVFTAGLASHKGPSERMRKETKYSFTLIGKGVSETTKPERADETLTVKVSGNDPGYQTTAEAFTVAALTLLKEKRKMPKGGVITAGVAYENTNLFDRLCGSNIKIDILYDK